MALPRGQNGTKSEDFDKMLFAAGSGEIPLSLAGQILIEFCF